MSRVWIDDSGSAADGDYVVRRGGDTVEVGLVEGGQVTWLEPVPADALPDLDGDHEALLTAVRGVATAMNNRGG